MRGAVEKRKATLAAKKAAQVAAEQRIGALAPRADAQPSQPSQRDMGARPVENPAFIHGYHNAYPHPAEQMQMPPQHHQQPHPHPADFSGYGVPFQS
jgi:hypothetical protein